MLNKRLLLAAASLALLASCGGGGGGDTTAPVDTSPQVTMTIDNGSGVAGSLVITLDPVRAPISVANFLHYVNTGFYTGTIFHRVVPNFVIQGGGYLPIVTIPPNLKTPLNPPIALEVNKGLSNLKFTIAMARTAAPASATSQFYINLENNLSLDPTASSAGYAVFGTVTGNTALVNAIAGAPCNALIGYSDPGSCWPNPNMVITSAVQTR